ncbi:MAG: hypothetical protein ACRYF5_06105, partial [Janthinobacterium lividum]
MGIIESYSKAAQSSNLKDDEFHHATEKLAAVALIGRPGQDGAGDALRRMGALMFRVKYSNDATSYPQLLAEWTQVVKSKASSRKWPADISPKKIARLSLQYWQNDICTVCGGMGHLPVLHVPNVLSDDPCKACNGTTKKPITAQHNLIQYVTDMVEC